MHLEVGANQRFKAIQRIFKTIQYSSDARLKNEFKKRNDLRKTLWIVNDFCKKLFSFLFVKFTRDDFPIFCLCFINSNSKSTKVKKRVGFFSLKKLIKWIFAFSVSVCLHFVGIGWSSFDLSTFGCGFLFHISLR